MMDCAAGPIVADLPDPAATHGLGANLARALVDADRGALVALAGELGAGKTALVRAVLCSLGYEGPVVSPSYTLIETYPLGARCVYHLDLYRIVDPEELEYLGVRELSPDNDWIFIEWAERGAGFLPAPDLCLTMSYRGAGRSARLEARSANGRAVVSTLSAWV